VGGLIETLLAKAAVVRLLRTTRLRADTTVVAANVSYATDSGLLAKAVRPIAATGRRIQAAGGATRSKVRDRSRSAGRRAHDLGSKLKLRTAAGRDAAATAVYRVSGNWRRSPKPQLTRPNGCSPTPGGRCGGHAPRPRESRTPVLLTPRRGGAAADWPVRSTTWQTCWPRPGRSPRGPGNASPVSCRS
jgi:IS5 family transposase